MVQGTCSNAGKSLLVAALCRIFAEDGLNPAPFKAQNMALNSFVTEDGREIGRAQALQAAACGRAPDTRMNPVLLKPSSDTGSQVLVMGRPVGHMRVKEYLAYKPQAWQAAREAYDSLSLEAGAMVIEGAGSPAEINLKAHDMVNMAVARHAEAPVLLVADIDRGGAFAALVGTMALLDAEEQQRVAGFVLNKFRGDASLLDFALHETTRRTGKPFFGVVPWLPGLNLPEEDSVSFRLYGVDCAPNHASDNTLDSSADTASPQLDIVLIDLPHLSNITDVDPLRGESDVRLRVVRRPQDLGQPQCIILPGSKNTPGDLAALHASGLAEAIVRAAHSPDGPCILGICGGLQMLGSEIRDPLGLEQTQKPHQGCSIGNSLSGLGLLPLRTELAAQKTLRLTTATHTSGLTLRGYEIHHGVTEADHSTACPILYDAHGHCAGWASQPDTHGHRIWGTYLHGVLDDDTFRRHFLNGLRARRGWPPLAQGTPYSLAPGLETLARAVRESLDMEKIYALLR